MHPLLSSSHSSQVSYKKHRPQHEIENVNSSDVSTLVKPNRYKAKIHPSTENPEARKEKTEPNRTDHWERPSSVKRGDSQLNKSEKCMT